MNILKMKHNSETGQYHGHFSRPGSISSRTSQKSLFTCPGTSIKLEDLKVLRRSPDHLNNVKIVQGQLQLIMEQILVK